jgi:transmembrane sensor
MYTILIIATGLYFIYYSFGNKTVTADFGEHVNYILPDNSSVYLNAGSEINFSENTFTKQRNVNLTGEATFEVTKGNDFSINTKLGNIQVLGTIFNVFARDNYFKVTCYEGKVRVNSGNSYEILTKGESCVLENVLRKTTSQQADNYASWRKGELTYENTPLNIIFEEIERQFKVEVTVSENETRGYTGSFTNKDLKEALDIICIPMGLKYEIENNKKVTIYK